MLAQWMTQKLDVRPVALAFLCLSVTLCSAAQRIERFAEAMGTTFSITAYVPDPALSEPATLAAFDEARRLDGLLSNYKPDSELSRVNRRAATVPVKVSPELFRLLQACLQASRESDGAFDITVGPLIKLWGFFRGEGHLPDPSAIANALNDVGYRNLILNPEQGTVRFLKPGIELDPGGVGKGYAIDRMAAVLRARGIHCALLSAGGSSIYAIGAPPETPAGWRIDIQDPRDSTRAAATVYLKDTSLSTSGGYEKFFQAGGKTYSHIMDPRTGYPAAGMLAVSVLCPRTLDSEIWAKPYYVLGRAWAQRHLHPNFRVLLCEAAPNASCAWIE